MTFKDDLREELDKLQGITGYDTWIVLRDKVNDKITKLVEGLIGKNRKDKTMFGSPDGYGRGYNQAKQEIRQRLGKE